MLDIYTVPTQVVQHGAAVPAVRGALPAGRCPPARHHRQVQEGEGRGQAAAGQGRPVLRVPGKYLHQLLQLNTSKGKGRKTPLFHGMRGKIFRIPSVTFAGRQQL